MRIDGSGSIDPKHVELVKRISERFKLIDAQSVEKTDKRISDIVLARVLQSFKDSRISRLDEVRERSEDNAVDVERIARSLVEKTREDAEI